MKARVAHALLVILSLLFSSASWSQDDRWLAIWPIDTISFGDALTADEANTISYLVPDLIAASLSQLDYRIVEREKLLEILSEQNLGASELADEDSRLQLGRLLGAQYMLFGQYTKLGSSWQLDFRVIQTETGKVMTTASANQEQGDLVSIAESIGLSLIPEQQNSNNVQ